MAQGTLNRISILPKLLLILGYAREILLNPRYLNRSIFDTLSGFWASYFLPDTYHYIYHYRNWDEAEINNLLREEYNWEGDPDTPTTWRIGDGTAAFYNYIYYVVAGFTEHDTFRSNQVRDGVIDRSEAMRLVREENKPRWPSLEQYAATIGFNLDEALSIIHRMPKLY